MKAYIDSSVVLRIILRASDALVQWETIDDYVSSSLIRVECLRTLERFRIAEKVAEEEIARRRKAIDLVIESIRLLNITPFVLARAAERFENALKTLDAIHLATAIEWRGRGNEDLAIATHDVKLARAARALDFSVLGA